MARRTGLAPPAEGLVIGLGVLILGGTGAVLRFTSDRLVDRRLGYRSLWPVAIINLIGSLTIGIVTGLVLAGHLSTDSSTTLTAGLCGGFTTWSTASVDTVTLWRREQFWAGVTHSLGLLIVATGAAGLGLVLSGA